jgi:hypothetical protein
MRIHATERQASSKRLPISWRQVPGCRPACQPTKGQIESDLVSQTPELRVERTFGLQRLQVFLTKMVRMGGGRSFRGTAGSAADATGIPGHRRERIEAAVVTGGRHASVPREAWIAADLFQGAIKVLPIQPLAARS